MQRISCKQDETEWTLQILGTPKKLVAKRDFWGKRSNERAGRRILGKSW